MPEPFWKYNRDEKETLYNAACILYSAKGFDAVCKFADVADPGQQYTTCKGCDTETPTMDNACFVCGESKAITPNQADKGAKPI